MLEPMIENVQGEKICTKCNLPKPLGDFSSHPHTRDRRQSWCKVCSRRYVTPKVKSAEYHMLTSARHRSLQLGLAFDLTIENIVVPLVCPLLGITLQRGVGTGGRVDSSPSLDRRDPTKGYTRDNVWVISWRANKIKSDATADELRLIARRLTENGL